MGGAAHIAQAMGLHPVEAVQRQSELLRRLGLPRVADVHPDAVRNAMGFDKKRSGGRTLWILPSGLGEVQTSRDVPDTLVDEAISIVSGERPA
jgi:3-dehydroquinate synthase/shikimate kinase/3-dehydroquinate synthase